MTTHANPEPIRLPVIREFDTGNGTFQQIDGYLFIPPDIARQIVAMAGIPRLDTDFIVSTEARIAALEARAQSQDRVDSTIGALLMPPPVEVPPGQRSRNPILDNFTRPAAPDADEAAVEAMLSSAYPELHSYDKQTVQAERNAMGRILAAIRSGAIRLPEDAAEIAALRAKLAEAMAERDDARNRQCNQLREVAAQRDRLAAQVESLTREHTLNRGTICGHVAANAAMERERDKALADLALANQACSEKQAAIEKFMCGERAADAEIARLKADLAASQANFRLCANDREWHRLERDAARAEADALRASRDKLAGLLREAIDNIPEHEWINYTDGLHESIKAALAEVGLEGGSGPARC